MAYPQPEWTPVCQDAGLYTIEKKSKFPLRSSMLVLEGGGTVIMSPIRRLGDKATAQLSEIGEPRFLLAPNHFHHLGLPEHVERYQAKVVASQVAAPRVHKQSNLAVEGPDELRAALPEHAELITPPGTRAGEAFLKVKTKRGVAWSFGDAFFNVPKTPGGFIGLMCTLSKTTPGLQLGKTFPLLALKDKRAYKQWILEQLSNDPPKILLPSHGEMLEAEDLGGRLKALVESRL